MTVYMRRNMTYDFWIVRGCVIQRRTVRAGCRSRGSSRWGSGGSRNVARCRWSWILHLATQAVVLLLSGL